MRNLKLSWLVVIVAVLLTAMAVSAQPSPLPVPSPASGRGVFSPAAPFAVPDELTGAVREVGYIVSTTDDEDDGPDCATSESTGDGLSLREALVYCADSDYVTIYVPAGTYTLDSEVDFTGTHGVTMVGADPTTTIIESVEAPPRVGSDRLFYVEITDDPLTLVNLTLRNGNATGNAGGALYVYGYGMVNIYNVAFEDNFARYGGAISFSGNGDPLGLTVNHASFINNSTEYDGGAIYFDGLNDNGHSIFIQNSDFTGNVAGVGGICDYGGAAIGVFWNYDYGGSVTLDNSLVMDNHLECEDYYGGAVSIYNYGSGVMSFTYSAFIGNSAPGDDSYGGALYIVNDYGTLNVSSSLFAGNSAGYGGAIYDDGSYNISISGSGLYGNSAVNDGGAVYLDAGNAVSILHSEFGENSAGVNGGAAYFSGEPGYIEGAQFSHNSAGDTDGLGGYGGAVFFYNYGALVRNTLIEDNSAETGPDCYTDGADVISLGGNGITAKTADCNYVPDPTDQFDNLLVNGGFEQAGASESVPAAWDTKNLTSDKRKCNKPGKAFTPFGACAFVFKGGAGESAQISQQVDLVENTFSDGEELLLYAVGSGKAASKAKLVAKASYTDTGLDATKVKLTFNGDTGGFVAQTSDALALTEGALDKLQVKVKHTGTGGKFSLDRVYLFSTAPFAAPPRSDGVRGIGGVLPPPAAPDGFRGGN